MISRNRKANDPFPSNSTLYNEDLVTDQRKNISRFRNMHNNTEFQVGHFNKKRGSDPVHLPLLKKNIFNDSAQYLVKEESIGAWGSQPHSTRNLQL